MPRVKIAKKLREWQLNNCISDMKLSEMLGITNEKRYKEVIAGKESITLDEWCNLMGQTCQSSLVFLEDYLWEINKRRRLNLPIGIMKKGKR